MFQEQISADVYKKAISFEWKTRLFLDFENIKKHAIFAESKMH